MIIPYVQRKCVELAPEHPATSVFGAFKGQQMKDISDILLNECIYASNELANRTDCVQPMDLSVIARRNALKICWTNHNL